MSNLTISWAQPTLWGDEWSYLQKALESTWISGGPFVEELETRMGSLCEMPYALAVANGTAAVHLAYLGLELQPGDEVIVPGFGFQAAANIALQMRLRPVFAEVDPLTWCITTETIEPLLTARTRAVVPVHTYGNLCPMDEICGLANRHNVAVIEDAAEAFGSRYRGRPAGSFGTISCFSFQATKTITTGEGGLVVTRDQALADRMRLYRSHGMNKRRYWHEVAGHNFRLTNLQSALGCAQLNYLKQIFDRRAYLHARYTGLLEKEAGITLQRFPEEVDAVLWALGCNLDHRCFPQGRDEVMDEMRKAGIETRPGFYAPSVQALYNAPRLPVSELLSGEIICLPFHTGLKDAEVDMICRTLLSVRHAG